MSLGGRTWLKRENQLPDFDLVTLRHVNALNDAAEGRWDLDHSFFRLKFHDRLAFRNLRTRRNHQPNEIPLMNVFAQFRKFEFRDLVAFGRHNRCGSSGLGRC